MIRTKTQNKDLYEKITHSTKTAPYSIHYTDGVPHLEPALYLHWHSEMEFLWLQQGDLLFHIEDLTFELHAGDAVFIPPGLIHYANNLGSTAPKFYAFVLSGAFLISPFETDRYSTYISPVLYNNISFATKLDQNISWQNDVIASLQKIFECDPSDELCIRGLSLLLWDAMYKQIVSKAENTSLTQQRGEKLSASIAYIHNNFSQNISLDTLADLAHLSNGQFCRSFKEFTGMTPFNYLIRHRILQSCNALLSTDDKVTDIAISCGFNNISYYNRAFFKLMGMTPKEYRKNLYATSLV